MGQTPQTTRGKASEWGVPKRITPGIERVDNTEHTLTEELSGRDEEEVIDVDIREGRAKRSGNGRTGKVVF